MNKRTSFIKAFILLLIGTVFVLSPDMVSKYLMTIIGVAIISYGLLTVLTAIKTGSSMQIKLAILIAVGGLLIILIKDLIFGAIGICFALYCLISGISNLGLGFRRHDLNAPYIMHIIKGATSLILGVIFIVVPNKLLNIQVILLGIYLIVSSIGQIYKALTTPEKDYDFIKFYFHNDIQEEKTNKKDDSIIDVEPTIKDDDDDDDDDIEKYL